MRNSQFLSLRRGISILGLCLVVQPGLAAEQDFPGLESLMTREEQRAAGLDALSPDQIEALNAWIARYTAGETGNAQVVESSPAAVPSPAQNSSATATATVRPAAPVDDFRRAPEKIDFVSRIAGEFNGWSGRTRFTLENGQVWEQRRGSRWKASLTNPEVRIYQNFMGAFEMEVLSEGRSIGVRRIQ